jgi:hypothetical protein
MGGGAAGVVGDAAGVADACWAARAKTGMRQVRAAARRAVEL